MFHGPISPPLGRSWEPLELAGTNQPRFPTPPQLLPDFSAIGEELGIVADLCRQVRAVREDGVVVMNRCRKVIFGPQIFIDANIPTLPVVRARPADVRFGQW